MNEPLSFLMLIGGCVYLLIGGDFLVRGALALSRRMSISPIVVGMTVVAFGTSAPELIVALHSSIGGYPGIALGNVVGSNIANVLLVVGVPALIHPLVVSDKAITQQAMFMVAVSIIFAAMCFFGVIGQIDGLLLLGIMAVVILLTWRGHMALPGIDEEEAQEQLQRVIGLPEEPLGIGMLILLGCIFLPIGADLAVDGAVQAASTLGVSEAAIGSTMVALGTSLPELSSTLIAAFRRSADMALGNVIGSNVLNILVIMGVTATLADIPVPEIYLLRDIWFMLGSSILLTIYIMQARPVNRTSGIAFCTGYVAYCVLVF
jgi:cation:H+ antiporter